MDALRRTTAMQMLAEKTATTSNMDGVESCDNHRWRRGAVSREFSGLHPEIGQQ